MERENFVKNQEDECVLFARSEIKSTGLKDDRNEI